MQYQPGLLPPGKTPEPAPPRQGPGTDPDQFPQIPTAPRSGGAINYQTGFNADRQAVNTGDVLGRLQREGQYAPKQKSQEASRAIADLQKGQTGNDMAHLKRGIQATNAAQGMQDQVTRSELMQSGLSNQAKIYSDMASREVDQTGLAARLQEAIIRNRFALSQALLDKEQRF